MLLGSLLTYRAGSSGSIPGRRTNSRVYATRDGVTKTDYESRVAEIATYFKYPASMAFQSSVASFSIPFSYRRLYTTNTLLKES